MRSADAVLLRRVREALDRWEAAGHGPTSGVTGAGAVRELERRFARLTGRRYALALPSGTLALRVALAAVGVGSGDEVVCAAYDWPATVAAARSLGARPVPVDIDPVALTLHPAAVSAAVSDRTRAVVATHLFGIPADVPRIRAVTDTVGIPVIEDCAHALGSRLDSQPTGALGALAAFSLGPDKAVDAGEGGLLVTDDQRLYLAAVAHSQHPVRQRLAGLEPMPATLALRIHPIAAILALSDLDRLPQRLARWRQHAHHAHRLLDRVPHAVWPVDTERRRANWYRVPVLLDTDDASTALTRCLQGNRPGGLLLHAAGEAGSACPNAQRASTACLTVSTPRPVPAARSSPQC